MDSYQNKIKNCVGHHHCAPSATFPSCRGAQLRGSERRIRLHSQHVACAGSRDSFHHRSIPLVASHAPSSPPDAILAARVCRARSSGVHHGLCWVWLCGGRTPRGRNRTQGFAEAARHGMTCCRSSVSLLCVNECGNVVRVIFVSVALGTLVLRVVSFWSRNFSVPSVYPFTVQVRDIPIDAFKASYQ